MQEGTFLTWGNDMTQTCRYFWIQRRSRQGGKQSCFSNCNTVTDIEGNVTWSCQGVGSLLEVYRQFLYTVWIFWGITIFKQNEDAAQFGEDIYFNSDHREER